MTTFSKQCTTQKQKCPSPYVCGTGCYADPASIRRAHYADEALFHGPITDNSDLSDQDAAPSSFGFYACAICAGLVLGLAYGIYRTFV